MKREIKFEYGFKSVNGIIKKVYNLASIPNIKQKCDVWNVLPIVYVRQFTGLKDKNGVDIYEGDILKHTRTIKNYDDDDYHLENRFHSQYETITSNLEVKYYKASFVIYSDANFHDCEIIGNIYENPELLKL